MREIDVSLVSEVAKRLCLEANLELPCDIAAAIKKAAETETEELAASVMNALCRNITAANERSLPICQDTGMAVIFLKIGQEVHFTGGNLTEAVNEGVRAAYKDDLRCSVVRDPLRRINTGDNTPAVIHMELTDGDKVEVTVAPKGFGSENMSMLCMLEPSASAEDIVNWVVEAVKKAGANPCPPIVVGVGIGGTFEKAALLAKEALLLPIDEENSDPFYAGLEKEIFSQVNKLNIGPAGFGGKTTALGVRIKTYPTHIAGLPVAVNLCCHVLRHKTEII